MARRVKLTETDSAFLAAVSEALQGYKKSRGPKYSNALLAAALGVDESTVAKYIRKKSPIMAEALARACVDLGVSFSYKGFVISATSFLPTTTTLPEPAAQLEFLFDAGYSAEKNSWRITQSRAEPMEFTLRIKIAS
jgi:transcriptional regulator with XRE-family HTH domain